MSKRITTLDDAASVSLPPEAVDALGVNAGDELDIEIVGGALVVRSADEARRSRESAVTFESVLKKRRRAYEQLAEGPPSCSRLAV
jgi:antitoxin component of MazEF toxin-antitoxin module